jgi:hypothetical protein
VTSTNVVLAVTYHGIQARDLGGNLVDLGRTPCDGEYQVLARVSPDGSAELHVLTHGRAAPCEETEYGTYEDARTLALCAYNILHD